MASKRPKGDANAMGGVCQAAQGMARENALDTTETGQRDRPHPAARKQDPKHGCPAYARLRGTAGRRVHLPGGDVQRPPQQLISRQAVAGYFSSVVTYEERATAISGWELGPVPGLLQTDAYARASITSRFYRSGHEEIGEYVTSRLEVQKIFARPEPPGSLVRARRARTPARSRGPAVMAAQLDHLLAISLHTRLHYPGHAVHVRQPRWQRWPDQRLRLPRRSNRLLHGMQRRRTDRR